MQAKLDGFVGSAMSKSHRESLLISASIMPEQAPAALDLLQQITADTVIRPEELGEIKSVVTYELDEMANKPEILIPELVHQPAFYGTEGVQGNSIFSIPQILETLKVEDIYEFRGKIYCPENIHVVSAGIPHEELEKMSRPLFSPLLPSNYTPAMPNDPSAYVGGSLYQDIEELPLVHIGLAWKGLPACHPDSYALAVMQMLLGGGGSFSAGGPGKGMYSRLYTKVLNRYHWIESAKVFNFSYSQTGLFGIHGSALPSHAHELFVIMATQLHSLARSPVDWIELERAKNQVKSAVLMGLESRMTQLEDLADQLTHRSDFSAFENPEEVCKKIDQVNFEDLQRVASHLLMSSDPSIVAYGNLYRMPKYDSMVDWNRSAINKEL